MKPDPCPGACTVVRELLPSHSAPRTLGTWDSDRDRSGKRESPPSWCYPAPPAGVPHRKTPGRGCALECRLPVADRESLLRRYRNWPPTQKQTTKPAMPARSCRRKQESLLPPSRRTSSRRPCVPGAAPHPGAAASADSARKTNCSHTLRDGLAGILPTPTSGSDGDVAAAADESFSSPVVAAALALGRVRPGSQTALASSSSSLSPSGNGQPTPAAAARSR